MEKKQSGKDPYLKKGRIAEVMAAIQVMAASQRPEGSIEHWAERFDGVRDPGTVARWTNVFKEHSEFFLVYTRKEKPDETKAALRWRYAFKTVDPRTNVAYTPAEIDGLADDIKQRITSKPLSGTDIQTLLNTAIALHTRAIEEVRIARWWVPIVAAFGGATFGALISGALGLYK